MYLAFGFMNQFGTLIEGKGKTFGKIETVNKAFLV